MVITHARIRINYDKALRMQQDHQRQTACLRHTATPCPKCHYYNGVIDALGQMINVEGAKIE